MARTLSILGSTGSIGQQTLDVVAKSPDDFRIRYLTVNTRIEALEEQIHRYKPFGVAISDEDSYRRFCRTTSFSGPILCGEEGVCEAAGDRENDIVMQALVGFSGVLPTVSAIEAGAVIALANKETLVSAGSIIMPLARSSGVSIIAVDSEHSAILQCLAGEDYRDIARVILTASGGPFRTLAADKFHEITVEHALKHPNWTMGDKITIDSATLMNKGFEVIEAHWLFDLRRDQIDVVVHPQSIIHSFVEFADGSVKAQLGVPDMRVPIAHALYYPRHKAFDFPRLDFRDLSSFTFEQPDLHRFPCLQLAFNAIEAGGTYSVVLNAANEIAVRAFLSRQLPFLGIADMVAKALERCAQAGEPDLQEIVDADREARAFVASSLASWRPLE